MVGTGRDQRSLLGSNPARTKSKKFFFSLSTGKVNSSKIKKNFYMLQGVLKLLNCWKPTQHNTKENLTKNCLNGYIGYMYVNSIYNLPSLTFDTWRASKQFPKLIGEILVTETSRRFDVFSKVSR